MNDQNNLVTITILGTDGKQRVLQAKPHIAAGLPYLWQASDRHLIIHAHNPETDTPHTVLLRTADIAEIQIDGDIGAEAEAQGRERMKENARRLANLISA